MSVLLEWKELCYDVDVPASEGAHKRVLNDLTGRIHPGQLMAILGPSGSGKTSLLNILGRRVVHGVSGTVSINGVPVTGSLSRIAGFVPQQTTFLDSLTVFETLLIAAKLKMAYAISNQAKKERVDHIIRDLDLINAKHTRIKQLSGGERRRVSIGIELINKPPLIFMDEPTSGLDSSGAWMVMDKLRHLAHEAGHTVVCSIHQPRASMLAMFDVVLLLVNGIACYQGPSLPKMTRFFADAGYPCPQFENPADYIIDLVNATKDMSLNNSQTLFLYGRARANIVDDRYTVVSRLSQLYRNSQLHYEMSKPLPSEIVPEPIPLKTRKIGNMTPWIYQFWIVMWRATLFHVREPAAYATQLVNATILPLIVGSVYYQMDLDQNSIQDRVGAISFIVLLQSFMAMDIILLFPTERAVFLRDQESGMYCASAFFWGRGTAEMPIHILLGVLAGTISYFMFGLQLDSARISIFIVVIVLVTITGASMLMMAGAISSNMEQANVIATVLLVVFLLFDGFYVNKNNIPSAYRWIEKISFLGYGVETAVTNEMIGLEFTCESSMQMSDGRCVIPNGEAALRRLGFQDVNIVFNVVILIVMSFFYRCLAFLGVKFLYRGKTFGQIWNE